MKKLKNIINHILENKKSKKINLFNELHNLKFEAIKTFEEVKDIVKNSNPNKEENKGFWLFDEGFNQSSDLYRDYKNVNRKPSYMQYCAVKYNDQIIGLLAYSLKYEEENYSPSIHIFDIQTLSNYGGCLKAYFDFFEDLAKKNNKKYLTLMVYESSLYKIYEKYGFIRNFKEYNSMYKTV